MRTSTKRKRKPSSNSRSTHRVHRHETVTVRLTRLGGQIKTLELSPGTTVKDLVKTHRLGHSAVRINGKPPRLATKLKDGDIVAAVPPRIAGTSVDRYDGLDLEQCRRAMSPHDFQFFVNFVGADALGVKDSDLDPV